MSTLPQPADKTAALEAEVARLRERLCDLGDELACLGREHAALTGYFRLLGAQEASPGASYTDPAVTKVQARRRRIEASGLRLVRDGG